MATIDPSIAMGYKPIQIENPLNQLAAMTQIQSGQQGQQLNALQMQKAQLELEDRNMLRGLDPNDPEYINKITRINPQLGLELLTKEQTRKTQQIDRETKINTLTQQMQRNLSSDPSDININKNFASFVSSGLFDANHIADAKDRRDQLLAMPLADRVPFLSRIGASAGDLKLVNQIINTGGQVISRNIDPFSSRVLNEETIQKTPTIADKIAQQRLTHELNSTGDFSPASLDLAANLYLQTGQLPNLGISRNAAAIKTKIYNRATELYGNPAGAAPSVNPPGAAPSVNPPGAAPNVNPAGANAPVPFNAANMAEQIVNSKMDVAAKSKAVRDFASGPESRKITAFNTAINHLDTLSKLSVALQNNDVQAINYIGNAFAKATGQPAPTTFDAAKSIIGSEIAKAVSGAGTTALGDRKEIREAIESKNSPAQLAEVINGFTELLGGQLDSMQHTYKSSTGRTDFNTKLTPRAREVVSKLSTNATASPTTVITSDGKKFNFPTPEDAAKFKQAAGIK